MKKKASSYECLTCTVKLHSVTFVISAVYRPPPSRGNGFKTTDFLAEWIPVLEEHALCKHKVIVVGDLNIHMDDLNHPETKHLTTHLDDLGMRQHVNNQRTERGTL